MTRQQRRRAEREAAKRRPAGGGAALSPDREAQLATAVELHAQGALAEAERTYRDVLAVAPDQPDALHLLGFLSYQKRDAAEAVRLIGRAIELGAETAEAHNNYGLALQDAGRIAESEAAFRRAVELNGEIADIHSNLGTALQDLGRAEEAVECHRRALELTPDSPGLLCNLAGACRDLGRFEEAAQHARRAIALNDELAEAHVNLGLAQQGLGRMEDAERSLRRAAALKPSAPDPHISLSRLLARAGRLEDAEEAARRATTAAPDYAKGHLQLGAVLHARGKIRKAEGALRRAAELDPGLAAAHRRLGYVLWARRDTEAALAAFRRTVLARADDLEAHRALAELLEQTNRLDEARRALAEGFEAAPGDPSLTVLAARLDRRDGRPDDALARLATLSADDLPAAVRRDVAFERGRLYDLAGDAARAFRHFVEANRLDAEEMAKADADKTAYLRLIDSLHDLVTPAWIASWPAGPESPADGQPSPVFLVGFPRSGTTLLERALDSHPRIQTLEEVPATYAVIEALRALPRGYPEALADLTAEQVEEMRRIYFQVAGAFEDLRRDRVVIDKLPLNMAHAALIRRLFPDARFILAVRHPLDACLSCFMQPLLPNDAMANFNSLEDGAHLYDRIMRLWRRYVDVLGLDVHTVRYEDVVEDFEAEMRRLVAFLGLDWDDRILGYTEHEKKRGGLVTPSYHQVAQPIYAHARYRWQRYADELAPVGPVLEPYIELFGYAGGRDT